MPAPLDPWWASADGAPTDAFGAPRDTPAVPAYGEPVPLPTGAPAWGYPTGEIGPSQPVHEPRGRLTLAVAVLATALVAGSAGGYLGYRDAERRDVGYADVRDPGATLGTAVPGAPVSRPANSVAGIAARVLRSVVSISVDTATGGGTGSGVVLRSDGYVL
ncbi:MAG: hypothetical protein ACXVFV_03240, partial [Mycobacteriales bacterium]